MSGPMPGSWIELLPAGGLIVARCGGMLAVAPPLGTPTLPPGIRAGAAGAIALCLVPVVIHSSAGANLASSFGPNYLANLCGELAIGVAMGFVAGAVVWAGRLAGQMLDTSLGLQVEEEQGPLERLYALCLIIVLLAGNGYRWLIAGMVGSFAAIPPGHAGGADILQSAVMLPATILTAAVWIAAPALAAIIVGDLAAAAVARVVPAVETTGLHTAVRWGLALSVIGLTLPLVALIFDQLLGNVTGIYQTLAAP